MTINSFFVTYPFPLAIVYTILTLAVGFQISRILYYRHNLFSFQLGFLVLCFVWGILRAVFWWLTPVLGSTPNVAAIGMLWIPLNLQFATFSLLVLFYAHLVHRTDWDKRMKKICVATYTVTNALFLILQAVCVGLFAYYLSPNVPGGTWLLPAQACFSAVLFLILVFILAYYGWLLYSSIKEHKTFVQPVPPQIFPVTFVIFILFLSRSLFDFVNASGHWEFFLNSLDTTDQVVVFLLYFFWEVLPTIMILVLFWRIPTTQIGGLPRRGRTNYTQLPYPPKVGPGRPYYKDNEPGRVSRLFNDPQRYDSDDETTSFLHKGSPISYTHSSTPHSFGKNTPYSTTPTPIQES